MSERERVKKKKRKKKPIPKEVEELLKNIKRFLKEVPEEFKREGFSCFEIVADELTKENLGDQITDLRKYRKSLKKYVRKIVDEILKLFENSRKHVLGMIEGIDKSEELLKFRGDYLIDLFQKFKQNKEFIGILEEIEGLKRIPRLLGESIRKKHYLYCINRINEKNSVLKSPKFVKIRALDLIRTLINETIESLPELLFEELTLFCYKGDDVVETKNYQVIKTQSRRRYNIRLSRRHKKRKGSLNKKVEAENIIKRRFSTVKDDFNSKVIQNSSEFIVMLVQSLYKLHQLSQAQTRMKQSLHLHFSTLVDGQIEIFLKQFGNTEKFSEIIHAKNSDMSSLDKIIKQKDILKKFIEDLFHKLLRVLKNFKFLIKLIDEKFVQLKADKNLKKSMKKKYQIRAEKIAKPTSESVLNQKLTKEVLLKLREAFRNKLNDLESHKSNENYINSMKDILRNFIEKEINDFGKKELGEELKVSILLRMFVDKLKSEVQVHQKGSSDEIEKIEKEFKELVIDSLSVSKTPETLKIEHVWTTVQDVLLEKLFHGLVVYKPNLRKEKSESKDSGIIFYFGSNLRVGKKKNDEYPLSNFFLSSYNLIWLYLPMLNFVKEAKNIIGIKEVPDEYKDHERDPFQHPSFNINPSFDILKNFIYEVMDSLCAEAKNEFMNKLEKNLSTSDHEGEVIFSPSKITVEKGVVKMKNLDSKVLDLQKHVYELLYFATQIDATQLKEVNDEGEGENEEKFKEKNYQDKFFEIVGMLMKEFQKKCANEFETILKKTYQKEWLIVNRVKIYPVLLRDPHWILRESLGKEIDPSSVEKFEKEMEEVFHSKLVKLRSIEKDKMINKSSEIIMLAHVLNTAEYIQNFLKSLYGQDDDEDLHVVEVKTNFLKEYLADIPDYVFMYGDNFQLIFNLCLFSLKLDVHIHCLYFLRRVLDSKYFIEKEPVDSERFVQQLNNDLDRIQSVLKEYLSPDKVLYIFRGLPSLYCNFFLNSLSLLREKKFNKNGVVQINQNLNSLHQNMNRILGKDNYKGRKKKFEKVRFFYSMLDMDKEVLFTTVKGLVESEDTKFNMTQFISLFEIEHLKEGETKKTIMSLLFQKFFNKTNM